MRLGKQTIGVVNTSSQINGAQWNRRHYNPGLAVGRGAFLGLLRINFLGLAGLISKRALGQGVTKAEEDAQPMGEKWWDIGAKWRNGWFNLGGKWDSFVAAVNKGKGRKPVGYKVAPKKLKDELRKAGVITGYGYGGIGAVDPATLTAAAGIIAALMPLILQLLSKTKDVYPQDEIEYILEEEETGDGENGDKLKFDLKTAGLGLLGVGVLAALFVGTKGKKKKLF